MIKEFVESGHFYSVIPNINTIKYDYNPIYNNIDFNDESHLQIIDDINLYLSDYDKDYGFDVCDKQYKYEDLLKIKKNNFQLINGAFEWMDARLLYYFILKNKPKNIIEIGCGNSTKLIIDLVQKKNLSTNIICIEPFPQKFLLDLHKENKIFLIQEKLENVELELFSILKSNDILFIDSSHVLKINSDVMYYINNIFPVLNNEVYIHIHDIFLPYEYPKEWLQEGRFWNEQYFIYAFLMNNNDYKIIFGNNYARNKLFNKFVELQKDYFETKCITDIMKPFGGGSLWIKKI